MGQLEEIQTRKFWNQNMVVTDYEYADAPIALGDLYGNRFSITLRLTKELPLKDEWELMRNIESLRQSGFINYFGLQRFGVNSRVKTYEIGRELVRQNWEEAYKSIIRSVCTDA
jgi:tRNA pseudouridine13 synthase